MVVVKYRIGEFSKLAKVPVKTLRYYEEAGILIPSEVDRWNNYRYYDRSQIRDILLIREYRAIGLTIEEIKSVRTGDSDIHAILERKKKEFGDRISRIDKMLERIEMKEYRCEIKSIKEHIAAYRRGMIKTHADLPQFVFGFNEMCLKLNPGIKCDGDYCYVTYGNPEYQEKDIELTYWQAVDRIGKSGGEIGFEKVPETKAVCVKHYGSYDYLGEAYSFVLQEIESKGYKICGEPRECYIDGCWNKEKEEDYLTEIQFPIE